MTKYEVQVQRVGNDTWVACAIFDTPDEAWAFKYEGSPAETNLGPHSALRVVPWSDEVLRAGFAGEIDRRRGPEVNAQVNALLDAIPLPEDEPVPESTSKLIAEMLGYQKSSPPKPRFDLIPMRALRSVAVVLALNVPKHGEQGWRETPAAKHFECALRHTVAHALGEKNDPDTGEPHLAHAAARILFMLEEAVS